MQAMTLSIILPAVFLTLRIVSPTVLHKYLLNGFISEWMDGRTYLSLQTCSYMSQKIQTDKAKNGKMTVDIMAVGFPVDCIICQQCF